MRILVVGGSRFVGPILVKKLLRRKHSLVIFNRGTHKFDYNSNVTYIKGNRDFPVKIPGHFDVVIDTCAYNAKQLKNVINYINFDYFVNFGTVASYKKTNTFPLTESSPLGSWPLFGDYNRGKVDCEKFLLKSSIKYSSIRPVYILGRANYLDREKFIYSNIFKGQKIIIPGNGQAVNQFVFAEDVANAIAFLTEGKVQGVFNCAGDETITLQGLVEVMAKIVGRKAMITFNAKTDGSKFNEQEFPFANEKILCSNNKIKELGIKFLPLIRTLQLDYGNYYKNLI